LKSLDTLEEAHGDARIVTPVGSASLVVAETLVRMLKAVGAPALQEEGQPSSKWRNTDYGL
jgi:hypothetical protein